MLMVTYQDGDMLQGAPTHKFVWLLNEVVVGGLGMSL